MSWVAISYLLTYASTLPVFARLSKVFGRKLLYTIGFVVFALASALCGVTSHLSLLIAFRLLQGVGGGLLGSNSMAILQASTPSGERGTAMGLYAAAQAVGISAGPIVGGLLLSTLGWRWIFWVTVPFSIAGWRPDMVDRTSVQRARSLQTLRLGRRALISTSLDTDRYRAQSALFLGT